MKRAYSPLVGKPTKVEIGEALHQGAGDGRRLRPVRNHIDSSMIQQSFSCPHKLSPVNGLYVFNQVFETVCLDFVDSLKHGSNLAFGETFL
jgi:hypothetical protein